MKWLLLLTIVLLVNISTCFLAKKKKNKQSEDELMNTCDISLLVEQPVHKDNKA